MSIEKRSENKYIIMIVWDKTKWEIEMLIYDARKSGINFANLIERMGIIRNIMYNK